MAKKKKSTFRGKVRQDAQRQKDASSNFGYLNLPKNIPFYNPNPGSREKFDIIPYFVTTDKHPDLQDGFPAEGDLWYKRPFKTHREVGADNEIVVCLTSFGEKCPICEYRKKRAKQGADKDELKGYNASQRNLYLVVPIGHKKLEEQIHVMDVSQFLFQDLLNDEIAEDEEYELFPDLEEGYTLKVRWAEGSFAGNKFAEARRIDFVQRNAYDEEILDDAPSLDDMLIRLSYKELESKFNETEDVIEETEEEDETPFKSQRKKKEIRRKKREEPEPEEEEDEMELTWDDLSDMDMTELIDVIDAKELDIDSDDYDEAEELSKAIAEELDIEIPKKKPSRKLDREISIEPVQSTRSKEKRTKSRSKNKCPNGYQFGKDTDEHDECDECDVWDACIDEKEG